MDHHAGHGGHEDHGDHAAQFRDRFWLSLALTVPVVAYSEMVQEWLGFTPPQFPGSQWVAPVLGTTVFLYGGWPFLQGGLAEARSRQPGMMLLISLAILVGFAASAASALGLFDLEFWWELALLIVIMLLGHWLEMRALGQASGALDALAALLPDQAERVDGDRVETVAVGDLAVGDLVLVRPGGRVPGRRRGGRGRSRAGRVDDHRRVPAGDQGARRPGGGRHRGHRLGDPGPGGRGGRGDRPGRDPPAGLPGPGVGVAGPGPGRPGGRAAVLVRPGGRADHPGRLAGPWRARPGGGADRDRAGDRLPPRPRAGHPPGHRHRDRAGGPQRHPGQGPAGPGADAHRGRGPVRQDRHPHQGAAPGHRGGDDRRGRRQDAAPGGGRRGRQRAPAGPGDRGRRRGPGQTCRGRRGSGP